MPARCYDSLSEVYTVPKESFLRKYGGRILGGLACAFVVSLIMHLTPVIEGIRWVGEGIRWSLGRPALLAKRHDPRPMGKRIEAAIDKAKEIASEHKPPKPSPKVIPKVAAPVVASAVPIVRKIEAIEKKIEKREEKLAEAGHDMADAARKTGDKIKNAIRARRDAKEQERYELLMIRARKVKLKVDDSWSLIRLEAEVNDAEDADWRKRFNGQCPKCHRPVKIHRDLKYGNLICPKCLFIYSVGWARSLGPPQKVHGVWGTHFPWYGMVPNGSH